MTQALRPTSSDDVKQAKQPARSALTAQVSAAILTIAIAVGISTQSVLCAGSALVALLLVAATLSSMTQPPTKRPPPPAAQPICIRMLHDEPLALDLGLPLRDPISQLNSTLRAP
mmetsp:Transcript_36043/g.91836  ORF Transcript_36043/g.91836 Transcript_36043/m.91836 type:complete len:115 (-) Transcript_36043:167-511(-)